DLLVSRLVYSGVAVPIIKSQEHPLVEGAVSLHSIDRYFSSFQVPCPSHSLRLSSSFSPTSTSAVSPPTSSSSPSSSSSPASSRSISLAGNRRSSSSSSCLSSSSSKEPLLISSSLTPSQQIGHSGRQGKDVVSDPEKRNRKSRKERTTEIEMRGGLKERKSQEEERTKKKKHAACDEEDSSERREIFDTGGEVYVHPNKSLMSSENGRVGNTHHSLSASLSSLHSPPSYSHEISSSPGRGPLHHRYKENFHADHISRKGQIFCLHRDFQERDDRHEEKEKNTKKPLHEASASPLYPQGENSRCLYPYYSRSSSLEDLETRTEKSVSPSMLHKHGEKDIPLSFRIDRQDQMDKEGEEHGGREEDLDTRQEEEEGDSLYSHQMKKITFQRDDRDTYIEVKHRPHNSEGRSPWRTHGDIHLSAEGQFASRRIGKPSYEERGYLPRDRKKKQAENTGRKIRCARVDEGDEISSNETFRRDRGSLLHRREEEEEGGRRRREKGDQRYLSTEANEAEEEGVDSSFTSRCQRSSEEREMRRRRR
ncbi:chloride chloride channel family, partial [Cystoisospora suis]